jgi:hypothetical protein
MDMIPGPVPLMPRSDQDAHDHLGKHVIELEHDGHPRHRHQRISGIAIYPDDSPDKGT